MKQALIEAGGTRIRPILMTAIATIGALVPLLFGHDSSILFQKMAATVIGGLISSTLLTLFVVPVIYEILFTLANTKSLICKKSQVRLLCKMLYNVLHYQKLMYFLENKSIHHVGP